MTNVHSSIGARLRATRESRGLQLAEIAGTLRIKPQFLDALESDRPEALPTPTHASGFLRTYAHYLGVDLANAIVTPPTPAITPLAPPLAPPGRLATVLPPLLVLGGLVILYAVWHWLQAPAPTPIAPPPADFGATKLEPLAPKIEPKTEPRAEPKSEPKSEPQAAVAPAISLPAAAAAAPAPEPAAVEAAKPAISAAGQDATAKPDSLVIRAVSDAWVQITDTAGRQAYSRLMRAGESWRAPQGMQSGQQSNLRLSTGNAGGIVLVRNGEAGAPLGAQAQVLRNLPLASPAVKAAPAPKPVAAEAAGGAPRTSTSTSTPMPTPAPVDPTAAADLEE